MVSPSKEGLDKLLDMQRQLMEKVPHDVRPDVYSKMQIALRLIRDVLQYLGACGHKPWRPNPLSIEVQMGYMVGIIKGATMLAAPVEQAKKWAEDERINYYNERELISVLGIIEEAVEYADAFGDNRKEEITDVLFFYLEAIILGGYGWAEIEEQYVRKHAENLERYRKAKEGDYSWDNRGKEGGL